MKTPFAEAMEQLEFAQKKLKLAQDIVEKINREKTPAENLLTPRELQLVDQLCLGFNIKQAANELGISVFTARTHVRNILGKLGVINMAAAIAMLAQYRPNLASK